MNDTSPRITMHGKPLTISGETPPLASEAPDFEALDNELKPIKLSDYRGKVVIISSIPSLDTPVCDLETRRFNSEAINFSDDIVVLTVSMDLPFAQKRWCGAAGVENVVTLSDHRKADFGHRYGVLIPSLRLLARAIFVLDRQGILRYEQIVPELSHEPDYEAVLTAVKEVMG